MVLVLAAVPGCGQDTGGTPDARPDVQVTDGWVDGTADATVDSGMDASADAGADAGADAASDAAVDAGPDGGTPPTPVRVLFIGNSYTAANNLSALVTDLAVSAGLSPSLFTSAITAGGARLSDHLANTTTVTEIQTGSWDFVVLQGQSVEALYDPAGFHAGAAGLSTEITNAGAQVLFFETWARAAGHAVYAETWSGGTPTAMQTGLRDAYQLAATNAGGQMAPVGDAWEQVLAQHPSMVLHTSDGSHPSIHGSYLAACVFYLALTGGALADTNAVPTAISTADASILHQAAEQAVLGP